MSGEEGDVYLHQAADGSMEPLDAIMVMQDAAKRMDKFYVLQMIELDRKGDDGSQYEVFQRWGRTGTARQGLNQNFDEMDKAVDAYMSKFLEKTSLQWDQREANARIAGHYVFIKQNFIAKATGYANMMWQYWVDDGVDGKQEGWYDYTSSGAVTTE